LELLESVRAHISWSKSWTTERSEQLISGRSHVLDSILSW